MNKTAERRLRNLSTIITHGGKFHSDDVFSTAFLLMAKHIVLNGRKSFTLEEREAVKKSVFISRVRNVPVVDTSENSDIIIHDIGMGEFDHHQGIQYRNQETKEFPYASFGKLFDYFKDVIMRPEVAEVLEAIVLKIDMSDNGLGGNDYTSYINTFMPTWDDENQNDLDSIFIEAVDFAIDVLWRALKHAYARYDAEDELQRAEVVTVKHVSGPIKVLILPKYIPWQMYAVKEGIQAAIYPQMRGGYSCSVTTIEGINTCKFPVEWNKENTDLEGITFVHASGFMANADTPEKLIEACEYLTDIMYVKEKHAAIARNHVISYSVDGQPSASGESTSTMTTSIRLNYSSIPLRFVCLDISEMMELIVK